MRLVADKLAREQVLLGTTPYPVSIIPLMPYVHISLVYNQQSYQLTATIIKTLLPLSTG